MSKFVRELVVIGILVILFMVIFKFLLMAIGEEFVNVS